MARKDQIVMKPSPFRAGAFEDITHGRGYALVQPKYRGMHLLWDGERLLTGSGLPVAGLPHVEEELGKAFAGVALEAEAYRHGWSEGRIAGLCRAKAPGKGHEEIRAHLFDLALHPSLQERRLQELSRRMPAGDGCPHLVLAPAKKISTQADLAVHLHLALAEGFEGLVVRDPAGLWRQGVTKALMKWKPGGQDSYPIAGVVEESGSLAGLRLVGAAGAPFTVRTGFSPEERRALWERRDELPGQKAVIRYPALSGRGLPQPGVFRTLVEAGG